MNQFILLKYKIIINYIYANAKINSSGRQSIGSVKVIGDRIISSAYPYLYLNKTTKHCKQISLFLRTVLTLAFINPKVKRHGYLVAEKAKKYNCD